MAVQAPLTMLTGCITRSYNPVGHGDLHELGHGLKEAASGLRVGPATLLLIPSLTAENQQ